MNGFLGVANVRIWGWQMSDVLGWQVSAWQMSHNLTHKKWPLRLQIFFTMSDEDCFGPPGLWLGPLWGPNRAKLNPLGCFLPLSGFMGRKRVAYMTQLVDFDSLNIQNGLMSEKNSRKKECQNFALGSKGVQSGPKGSKRVQNGQSRCFWPFGTFFWVRLDLFGPFQSIQMFFSVQKHLRPTLLCPYGATKGPQIVNNI